MATSFFRKVHAVGMVLLFLTTAASAEYVSTTSWHSLFYSKATSCNVDDITTWTCEPCVSVNPGFQLVSLNDNTDSGARGFIGFDGTRIVVAFRGSSNIQNWIDDLNTLKMRYPNEDCNCQVHTGFLTSYTSLKSWLMTEVAQLLVTHPSAEVLVVGHSLGGAQALLASLDIVTNQMNSTAPPTRVLVYTYGAPRVGDAAFAEWASDKLGEWHTRVTHLRDPVNHLPTLSQGFLHNTQEIWYPDDSNTTHIECDDEPCEEDPYCSNYVYPLNVMDHMWYLGQCTGCSCDASTVAMMRSVRLNEKTLQMLVDEADELAQEREGHHHHHHAHHHFDDDDFEEEEQECHGGCD